MSRPPSRLHPDASPRLASIVEALHGAVRDSSALQDDEFLRAWRAQQRKERAEKTERKEKKKERVKMKTRIAMDGMQRATVAPELSSEPEVGSLGIVALLKECAENQDLQRGSLAHRAISESAEFRNNPFIVNALISMYAKCGDLENARGVLSTHPSRNVVSWSALIAGYVRRGLSSQALRCLEEMEREGVSPDEVTFSCILKACGEAGALEKGEKIHREITRRGLILRKNVVLGTALVAMYGKCGTLSKAWEVMEELSVRNVVTWSALISGYTQHGCGENALTCYELMQSEGVLPNSVTLICTLQACGATLDIAKGEEIYTKIIDEGWIEKDVALGSSLVDMYVKCGALSRARAVLEDLPFRSIATWSVMIGGYANNGLGEEALDCFDKMQREGRDPNEVTFTFVAKACGAIREVERGERLHEEIVRRGYLDDNLVLGTALVDMYVRCGDVMNAAQVHHQLRVRDIVCWNTLIAGYAEQGKEVEALACLNQLKREGLSPDAVTLGCMLRACGHIGASGKGAEFHVEIVRQELLGMEGETAALGTALVHMYVKCGAVEKAREMLGGLRVRNVFMWSSLIAGYAQQGQAEDAFCCFREMQSEGLSPNAIVFGCVLNACSHSGLVDEGEMYFTHMRVKYGIEPDLEHFTCMVDLFGRAGHLDKAMVIIEKMPLHDYRPAWSALLNACHQWGNAKLGKLAFKHAVQIDSGHIASYVCMSNISTAASIKDGSEMIG